MSTELDRLVETIAQRVQERLQAEIVSPLPAVMGSWQDPAGLRQALSYGAVRLGSDGAAPGNLSRDVARLIDHTLLKPTATRKDIEKLCAEARQYGFASVCVNSTWVGLCARLLADTQVMAICVVGFPLGAASTDSKAHETRVAIGEGAAEIDMVINIGQLKSGNYDFVLRDIQAVVAAAQGRPVKVIIETSLLTRDEKVAASALCKAGGAAFVKTSTGFAGGGATVEDIQLIRAVVGPDMKIKASGGVKSAADAQAFLAASADRLGASASVAIVTGGKGTGSY